MTALYQRFLALALTLLCLVACAAPPASPGRDKLPGNAQYYSFGPSQSKESSGNLERAQFHLQRYSNRTTWNELREVAPSFINMLQVYFPLHVRWQLKDGRQFIAHIDTRAVMREYFKTNDLQMQWQREGRAMDNRGDFEPSLVHEVKDDQVILKWHMTINHTPVNERFAASGAANRWKFSTEEHLITTIQGQPTSGIDFDATWDFKPTKPIKD